jgi:hypothetical protein
MTNRIPLIVNAGAAQIQEVAAADVLTVPGTLTANTVQTDNYQYANGQPFSGGGGNANTGNVTFSDQAVIGTGDEFGGSGLYLAPGANSVGNVQYLRVRGGDVPTHIHLDTGDNGYFDQYFGDDSKYIKLESGGNISIGTNTYNWAFDTDGGTGFPTLNVQRGDNPSGTIQGQTLLFGDNGQEAIITTPNGVAGNEYSQRLVINPGAGYDYGEGGDIYLWAGRGGDNNGSGGDIKIRGGQGMADGTGGYIRIEGGDSQANGYPGYIDITGGQGGNAEGGYVHLTGGQGATAGGPAVVTGGYGSNVGGDANIVGGFGGTNQGGNINITGGGSANGLAEYGNVNISAGASTWQFGNDGTTTFPTGNITSDTSLQLTTTFGNYRTVEYQTAGVWDVYVEDVATGPNDAWSWIDVTFKDNLINKPQVFIENQKASDGIALRWTFDENGNLTLPSNIASINYANGNPYGGSGGTANTGNVTFSDQIVIGTGISNLVSGLYLSPSSSSANAVQYLRVRGDVTYEPTHIHFDTGNNQYFNQFIGDDNKYVLLSNIGNIVINTDDYAGNSAQWTFGVDGNLTVPGNILGSGNILIAPDSANSGGYLDIYLTTGPDVHIASNGDSNLILGRDSGANVTVGTSGNVSIQANTGTPQNWIFGNDGEFYLPTGGRIGATKGGTMLDGGAGNSTSLTSFYANGFYAGCFTANPDGNVAITTYTGNGVAGSWQFDNTGNLTLSEGGNLIVSGAIVGSGASPAPYLSGFDSVSAITLSASGNITASNISTAGSGGDITLTSGNITGANVVTANTVSATGNVYAANFFGNTLSQRILPTIQSIVISNTSSEYETGGGSGYANVLVANVAPVIEYGVIVTAGSTVDKYVAGNLANIPGTEQIIISTGTSDQPFTVYAYVTTNAGTYYSGPEIGFSGLCLLKGTMISLADGTYKPIEDINNDDLLLTWDFDLGRYAQARPLWIKRGETGTRYNELTFSDGTILRTFDQHRIFNKQAGAFTYPMSDDTPVGTVTVNEHGQEITLVNRKLVWDTIEHYNIITNYHINLFADSVLTSCRFNNIYPITDMKFVKDVVLNRNLSEFDAIESRFVSGLRLQEQSFELEMIEGYVNRLLATEATESIGV